MRPLRPPRPPRPPSRPRALLPPRAWSGRREARLGGAKRGVVRASCLPPAASPRPPPLPNPRQHHLPLSLLHNSQKHHPPPPPLSPPPSSRARAPPTCGATPTAPPPPRPAARRRRFLSDPRARARVRAAIADSPVWPVRVAAASCSPRSARFSLRTLAAASARRIPSDDPRGTARFGAAEQRQTKRHNANPSATGGGGALPSFLVRLRAPHRAGSSRRPRRSSRLRCPFVGQQATAGQRHTHTNTSADNLQDKTHGGLLGLGSRMDHGVGAWRRGGGGRCTEVRRGTWRTAATWRSAARRRKAVATRNKKHARKVVAARHTPLGVSVNYYKSHALVNGLLISTHGNETRRSFKKVPLHQDFWRSNVQTLQDFGPCSLAVNDATLDYDKFHRLFHFVGEAIFLISTRFDFLHDFLCYSR